MIKTEEREDIKEVIIDRPHLKNALNIEAMRRLRKVFEGEVETKSRVIILTGSVNSFSSGMDMSPEAAKEAKGGVEFVKEAISEAQGLIRSVINLKKPVIAKIRGPAVGIGCDLALACDLKIASKNSYLSQLYIKRGLIPDGGGTYFLLRLVGLSKAMELILLGDRVYAEEAEKIGLINKAVSDDELDSYVEKLALRLAKGPAHAMGLAKTLIWKSMSSSLEEIFPSLLEAQVECFLHKEFTEGLMAFLEKREPDFRKIQ